ncbi:hypothetical protein LINPERPRIM_LOCUS11339 [Linum perenne]
MYIVIALTTTWETTTSTLEMSSTGISSHITFRRTSGSATLLRTRLTMHIFMHSLTKLKISMCTIIFIG